MSGQTGGWIEGRGMNEGGPGGGSSGIRAKVVSIYLLGLVVPAALGALLLYWLGVAPAVWRLEEAEAARRLEACERLISQAAVTLQAHAADYGTWDDMYRMADQPDAAWVKANLTDWVPKTFQVQAMALLDAGERVSYEYGNLTARLGPGTRHLMYQQGMSGHNLGGLVAGQDGLYLVAWAPVRHTDQTGPTNGVYLVAKAVTDAVAREVGRVLGDGVFLYRNGMLVARWDPFALPGLPTPAARLQPLLEEGQVRAERLNGHLLVAYSRLNDLFGKRIGTLGVVRNRTVADQARNSAMGAGFVLALVGLLFVLVMGQVAARWVVRPLETLAAEVRDLEDGRLDHPIATGGRDEIGQLARAFEQMRDSLQRLVTDLKERQAQLEQANAHLEELATTDTLTGLRTRHFLNEWLPTEVLRCERFSLDLGCLMLDIDEFKRINDRFGHPFGDKALAGFSKTLLDSLRAFDVAVRYGGEEALVLLPQTSLEHATEVAERIVTAVAQVRYGTEENPTTLTVSIGVASLRSIARGPDRSERLIQAADEALYEAKRLGKNRVAVWSGEAAAEADEPRGAPS